MLSHFVTRVGACLCARCKVCAQPGKPALRSTLAAVQRLSESASPLQSPVALLAQDGGAALAEAVAKHAALLLEANAALACSAFLRRQLDAEVSRAERATAHM